MIKYLGSKRTLVPLIKSVAGRLPVASACDLFAGTTRVGQALRSLGITVHSNDLATYSEVLGQAYIVADETLDRERIAAILAELSALEGREGYFTEAFCRRARFFQPENGARIDAIRDAIDGYELSEVERGVVLTSLLEAADRVDSTTGLQMAYLKAWAPRSYNELSLRLPEPVAGPAGHACPGSTPTCSRPHLDVDLVYIDPPYNQHSFFSNYHVWETLVRWDAPESYGVANKRVDCRERRSAYNSKRSAPAAFAELLASIRAPWVLVSVSNEGFHDAGEIARAPCRAWLRRPDRRRLEALRRRADRDLQPFGREGRHRLAPAKPRDPADRGPDRLLVEEVAGAGASAGPALSAR